MKRLLLFFRQTIEQATVEARFDMAHNRTVAIRSFELFYSKDSTNRMQKAKLA